MLKMTKHDLKTNNAGYSIRLYTQQINWNHLGLFAASFPFLHFKKCYHSKISKMQCRNSPCNRGFESCRRQFFLFLFFDCEIVYLCFFQSYLIKDVISEWAGSASWSTKLTNPGLGLKIFISRGHGLNCFSVLIPQEWANTKGYLKV